MKDNKESANTYTSVEGRELKVTRIFHASRELVYNVWTDPNHLSKWWGPRGFTITNREIDIRPGGVWRYIMHGPDGTDYDNKMVFIEMESPERLVYAHGDDENEHFRVTVTFEEYDDRTELTMRSLFNSAKDLQYAVEQFGAVEGAKSTLDRFEEILMQLK